MSAVELVLNKIACYGKFGGGGYKVSVFFTVCRYFRSKCIEEWTKVQVYLKMASFKKSILPAYHKTSELYEIGKAEGTGTTVIFKPDSGNLPWCLILIH